MKGFRGVCLIVVFFRLVNITSLDSLTCENKFKESSDNAVKSKLG